MAKFYKFPFAVGGDKAAIPDPTQVSGSMSYTQGYPVNYQLDQNSNPSALDIDRQQFNQLMYDATLALQQYQTFGFPDFISTSDNGGTPYPYDKYATVRYDDGVNGPRIYQSLVNSNTALPTDTTKWVLLDADLAVNKINIVTFNISGTYVRPVNLLFARVKVIGGGGGGGGDGTSLGSGGGSGAYGESFFNSATLAANQTITIGNGGAPNANGGSTSFGSLITATGGNKGNQDSSAIAIIGGAGGVSTGGNVLNVHGSYGGTATAATSNVNAGFGAPSFLGAMAPGSITSGNAGIDGYGPGSGGAGAWNASGGNGQSGIVYIEEYLF